jgi:putative DNA primase/helicase
MYKARLRRLLETRMTMTEAGQLSPAPLDMTPEAFELWRQFHDRAEVELRQGGELTDVRDVASKAADNCARVAALLHLFAHGPGGRIGADNLAAAAHVVTWHLFEARRLLSVMALPKALSNAAKLDAWLLAECMERGTETVSMREVQRLGPNPVRLKSDLLAALAELKDAKRARLEPDGRMIRINPSLLGR